MEKCIRIASTRCRVDDEIDIAKLPVVILQMNSFDAVPFRRSTGGTRSSHSFSLVEKPIHPAKLIEAIRHL
jgi:hypothetical protein